MVRPHRKRFLLSRFRLLLPFLILATVAATVYGLSGQSHEFPDSKCGLCHFDEKNEPAKIRPAITDACNACHGELEMKKSHPSDVYPTMQVPQDMPLTEGRLTCLTCHYAHLKDETLPFTQNDKFLRKQVRGIFFCSICHSIDKNRHIVFENVHSGSYTVKDRSTRIDRMSLECIECHDSYMKSRADTLGAGTWNHSSKSTGHPIGINYKKIRAKNSHKFRPEVVLSREIRLFNGNIGCGTCHNIYSQEKKMLATSNMKSRLCLGCHIK